MCRRILIVDDEQETTDLLAKRLRSHEFDIVVAHTGRQGLRLARQERPDVILMDIMLPDMEGPEAAKELSNDVRTAHIPLIFLSGIVSDEEQRGEAEITAAGRRYPAIAKPFTIECLLDKIHQILP